MRPNSDLSFAYERVPYDRIGGQTGQFQFVDTTGSLAGIASQPPVGVNDLSVILPELCDEKLTSSSFLGANFNNLDPDFCSSTVVSGSGFLIIQTYQHSSCKNLIIRKMYHFLVGF
jgi:hypothetical protein